MSDNMKELKVQLKSFLGSERAYWHGNSLRVALPIELVEKLELTRGTGKLVLRRGEKRKFLFFDTDKGILLKVVDEETDRKLREVLGVMSLYDITDEDMKILFS